MKSSVTKQEIDPLEEYMLDEDLWVFAGNGDGTFDCEWCGGNFDNDLAHPDFDLNPICPDCIQEAMADNEFYEELNANTKDNGETS